MGSNHAFHEAPLPLFPFAATPAGPAAEDEAKPTGAAPPARDDEARLRDWALVLPGAASRDAGSWG